MSTGANSSDWESSPVPLSPPCKKPKVFPNIFYSVTAGNREDFKGNFLFTVPKLSCAHEVISLRVIFHSDVFSLFNTRSQR